MPLEVRELIVRVEVGGPLPIAPRRPPDLDLAALKREIVETCLAELRLKILGRDER